MPWLLLRFAGQKQVNGFCQHLQYPTMHLTDALSIISAVLQATVKTVWNKLYIIEFASNIYSSLTNPTVCRNWNFCNENNAVKESSKCCLPSIATLFFSVLFSYVLVASTTDDSILISISSCLGMKRSGFFEFVTTLTE